MHPSTGNLHVICRTRLKRSYQFIKTDFDVRTYTMKLQHLTKFCFVFFLHLWYFYNPTRYSLYDLLLTACRMLVVGWAYPKTTQTNQRTCHSPGGWLGCLIGSPKKASGTHESQPRVLPYDIIPATSIVIIQPASNPFVCLLRPYLLPNFSAYYIPFLSEAGMTNLEKVKKASSNWIRDFGRHFTYRYKNCKFLSPRSYLTAHLRSA